MHVLFLPDRHAPRFFVWGEGTQASALCAGGVPERVTLIGETLALCAVEGIGVPLLDALPRLAALESSALERASASTAAWSAAAKLALDLVGRERLVPRIVAETAGGRAQFKVSLALREDAERVAALARAFPLAAHAVPLEGGPRRPPRSTRLRTIKLPKRRRAAAGEVWAAEALLRAFLDATADALVRTASRAFAAAPVSARPHEGWEQRWLCALLGPQEAFASEGFGERGLLAELETWSRPALGADPGEPRACFRLEYPPERSSTRASRKPAQDGDAFPLRVFLQAADDPSLLVPVAEVFGRRGRSLGRAGRTFHAAEELLLRSLATAARLFPPLGRALRAALPEGVRLDLDETWAFLTDGASALTEAGLGVILPADLTRSGQRRLRLRLRVGARTRSAGATAGASTFSLDEVLAFRWEAAIGDAPLTERELSELAELKAPLVRLRGEWVAVDRAELDEVRRLVNEGGGTIPGRAALAAVLSGSAGQIDSAFSVEMVAEGALGRLVARLREGGAAEAIAVPSDFLGKLRPYQERGLAWLVQMSELGLGACLADDMGLGKTIQFLAYLLERRRSHPKDHRPALLVCPTSVLGNWEREIARFAPSLSIARHYGPERARTAERLRAGLDRTLVLTTYGLLRRDAAILAALDWSVAALDEAQNVKNSASRGAQAARSLRAGFRVALTGTPVENRLAELWSLFEFLNPGLLGPLEAFRREIAIPVERYGRDDVAERLSRIVRPFLLRRLKSDPRVVRDLPAKLEMKVVCTLTREQASLYQATVAETMRTIEASRGIQRRGLVLALLTALKQICNHPAHYLSESGPLERRSGKLTRLLEMLEELLAAGDRALVFTQFREMGERLVAAIASTLGTPPIFLHGGVPRARRDAMVRAFQEDPRGPRVFVLSLKAGGTGLNLTAASHVFHFDRWWNPAVEDQATDRAHRIGQKQRVQVHKLMCAGTVEDKIDQMLEKKRGLAERIVGRGEQWITELENDALRELFSLAPEATRAADELGALEADAESAGAPAPARRRKSKPVETPR